MLTQSFIVPFLFVLLAWASSASLNSEGVLECTYIVHVSNSQRPAVFATTQHWYSSMLASAHSLQLQDLDKLQHGPIYSYGTVFHGFAAKLTPAQAQALQKMQGVLSIVEDGVTHLHTTRTPKFLGLNTVSGLWPASNYGDQVIIGVMDTGIWPERESFDDKMVGPVPPRWKGACELGQGFNVSLCNKKLIGARAFYKGYEAAVGTMNETEYKSARDSQGHGTHTASTAAGNYVYNASLGGLASGTARGMATLGRIAVYKVCWQWGCADSDILAAFEQAIDDGVDIISLSVGSSGPLPYFRDFIAIGSFGAMEKGVLVSVSAGNSGPSSQSISSVAPWLLTVGASTIDRNFPAIVKLPSNVTYTGASLYTGDELSGAQLPLIYAGLPGGNASMGLCLSGFLDPALVKGKIVVCDCDTSARTAKGVAVKKAGGAGMILANTILNGEDLIADSYNLPALLVGYKDGVAIKDYIGNAQAPTATLVFRGTVLGVKPAPVMAAFSSRGPNALTPEILKPDVTAPGVNILAAWTGKVGPTEQPSDDQNVAFNIMSGTSMSCPHVSGLAALLKAAHPEWSPAAIKSALMTTAFSMDNMGNIMEDDRDFTVATPFAFGAGHVDAAGALDPGLIYDLKAQDYVNFLCSINLTSEVLMIFTKGEYNCSDGIKLDPSNLNYPSLSFVYYQDGNTSSYISKVSRTVTNVGWGSSLYKVTVSPPPGVSVEVEPSTLSFTSMYERKTYTVTCEASAKQLNLGNITYGFGSLIWSDETHHVRSPIVFTWQN